MTITNNQNNMGNGDGVNFHNVPKELQNTPQWVLWRLVYDKSKDKKPRKVPFQINGDFAKSNDKNTHASFKDVVKHYNNGGYDGIGFVFTKDDCYVGVDLDGVCENGVLSDEATKIVDALDSYTEYSPSKTGLHIICRGKLPDGARRKQFIEMYEDGRYFTVTGDVLNNTAIQARNNELKVLHDTYLKKTAIDTGYRVDSERTFNPVEVNATITPTERLQKAFESKHGVEIEYLYNGDFTNYQSQSEADLAFCNHLAFWMDKDVSAMDSIFRSSGLYRKKWDEKHSSDGRTYGQITLENALNNCVDGYKPKQLKNKQNTQAKPKGPLKVSSLADVNTTVTQWLCKPYLPLGKIVILVADPGTGKTFLALKFCEIVSNGAFIVDENHMFFGHAVKKGLALYQTAEDGIADTIKPRLEMMGANMENIIFIDDKKNPISFAESLEQIETVIAKYQPKLVVFDPIQAYIGANINMNMANQTRAALTGVGDIAEKYGCTILIVAHRNKQTTSKSSHTNDLYRTIGSVDYVGIARSVLTLANNPDIEGEKILIHTKSNLAKSGDSVAFHIDTNHGGIVFDGFRKDIHSTADLGTAGTDSGGKGSPKLEQAREFLKSFLSKGPKYKDEIVKGAFDYGLDVKNNTLNIARDQLGIKYYRESKKHGKTIWCFEDNPQIEDLDEKEPP